MDFVVPLCIGFVAYTLIEDTIESFTQCFAHFIIKHPAQAVFRHQLGTAHSAQYTVELLVGLALGHHSNSDYGKNAVILAWMPESSVHGWQTASATASFCR